MVTSGKSIGKRRSVWKWWERVCPAGFDISGVTDLCMVGKRLREPFQIVLYVRYLLLSQDPSAGLRRKRRNRD